MSKRIKTVWILSIITMILIFCGQTYWLINQYEFTTSLKIEKLKKLLSEKGFLDDEIRLALEETESELEGQ